MEMNLALTATHSCTVSVGCGQLNQQLLEGFNPKVEFNETKSCYSLHVHFAEGFRREDISLEMDNMRALLIRGQAGLEGLGMVAWTWHLMEGTAGRSFRRPFKIPHNVNVDSITGSFHQGVLHVEMPKHRWNRFRPYNFNGFTRNPHYYDPLVDTMQETDQGYQADPTVQDVADELKAEANELIGQDNTEGQIRGAHVTADHSDLDRLMPDSPEETETIDASEDASSRPTEQSVDDFLKSSSSGSLYPQEEENVDLESLVEEMKNSSSFGSLYSQEEKDFDLESLVEGMKNASISSQNRQDLQQQQPPDPCQKEEEGEILEEGMEHQTANHEGKTLHGPCQKEEEEGGILEECMEHQTANHEGKTLQGLDDDAANSHSLKGVESIVEPETIKTPNSPDSEAEKEDSVQKVIPPNGRDLVGNDADERAVDTLDLHPKRFFVMTKTKIAVSVLVSAVALMTARKWMRRS